jgi:transposase InsO family protein
VTYAFMAAHTGEFPVNRMCEVLNVSRSGYYDWRKREPSQRQQANETLAMAIRQVYETSRESYGSPRIQAALQQQGIKVSRKRVARLMQQHGLIADRPRRRRPVTTQREPGARVAPNVLGQNFTARRPDEIWLSDITYLETAEGWLYLAVVMDLFTRLIVGWSMAAQLHATLVEQALRLALGRRHPTGDLMHHSDQGSQYTSDLIRDLLAEHHIQVSMSDVGNCYDNAPMESFFGRLKTECASTPFATHAHARLVIFEHLEVWYNRQRLHSSLGYLSPAAFEQRHYETHPVR